MSTAQTLADAVSALNNVATSHEQLNATMTAQQDVVEANFKALQDFATHPDTATFKDKNGTSFPVKSLRKLAADAEAVNPNPHVMSKAEFDALRELRKSQYAGSGFVEMGKYDPSPASQIVDEGLWCYPVYPYKNCIFLGRYGLSMTLGGASLKPEPVALVDGVLMYLEAVGIEPDYHNQVKLPLAPDGTKTYDSSTGVVTKHASAEVAFASETATNKVILSRKDLVFLEVWHEKILEKDVIYPLGNVQFGASSWSDIALSNALVEQGYSALGAWDETTKGHGVRWSSLSEENRNKFLSDPKNNIYFDAELGEYVQVRYRVRVVEGYGDQWNELRPSVHEITTEWAISDRKRITFAQGLSQNITSKVFVMKGHTQTTDTKLDNGVAEGEGTTRGLLSHGQTKPLAIPIALVQRLNQGAYHPAYNPFGTNFYTLAGVSNYTWNTLPSNFIPTTESCFIPATTEKIGMHPTYGAIASYNHVRKDQYLYHDAVYAGQVEDLRLSAKKQNVTQLLETSMQKAVRGALRGKGKVPFTRIFKVTVDSNTTQGFGRIPIAQQTAEYLQQQLSLPNSPANITNRMGMSAYVVNPNNGLMCVSIAIYDGGTTNCSIGTYQTNAKTLFTAPLGGSSLFRQQLDATRVGRTLLTGSGNSSFVSTASFCAPGDELYLFIEQDLSPEFDGLPWVDIIGHPERVLATFPDGVIGQWVSKLPNSTSQQFALNKKVKIPSAWALTNDNGNTWSAGSLTIDEAKNAYISPAEATRVQLIYYEAQSNFSKPEVNSIICGSVGDVFCSDYYKSERGNRLNISLTGKIGTNVQSTGIVDRYLSIESFALDNKTLHWIRFPIHAPIQGSSGNSINGQAFKVLTTITEKHGLLYLQCHGTELKHNGTDWGDDQTIPIINGEDVKTDLNGNTVKVFCHHSVYPLGIAHND
ncbi:hypothetical protein [Pseudoalteromonas xiamenensis]